MGDDNLITTTTIAAAEVGRRPKARTSNSTEIEEHHLLKALRKMVQTRAIQWVFNTYLAEDGVATSCKGHIWVV